MNDIDPRSIEYWSRCLYGSKGFFDSDQTIDAVNADKEFLRKYADNNHSVVSPYGDVYYIELDSLLVEGMSVLEFGCGSGLDSYYMHKRGARVTACDIVPTNVLVVRRMLEPEARVVMLRSYDDLDELGTFDLVYSHGCLHHVPPQSIQYVLEKLCNRMHVGSKALVMVYTSFFYPHENAHPEGPYARGYSDDELHQLFGPSVRCLSTRVFMNGCFMWGLFEKV